MGKVIMHCQMIRKHTGATVILIHHAGKDSAKGARGWSGLRAAADTEIEIMRVKHDRIATITKQKDGTDGTDYGFKLRPVQIGASRDGAALTSCVVDHGEAMSRERRKARPLTEDAKTLCDALAKLTEGEEREGRKVLTSVLREHFRRAIYAEPDAKDNTSRDFPRALNDAVKKGVLAFEGNYAWLVGNSYGLKPEPTITRVFEAMGWTVVEPASILERSESFFKKR